MDITGYVVLATSAGIASVFIVIILKELFDIKFSFLNIFPYKKRNVMQDKDQAELLMQHDIVLVGEFHRPQRGYFSEKERELFQKELGKERRIIQEAKPTYLLIETSEEELIKHEEYWKALTDVARSTGAQVVPMDKYSLNSWMRTVYGEEEKSLSSLLATDAFRNTVASVLEKLSTGYRDKAQMQRASELLEKYPELQRFAKPGELDFDKDKLSETLSSLDRRLPSLRMSYDHMKKAADKIKVQINQKREEHWAEAIRELHEKNPDAKLLLIAGTPHVKEGSKLTKLLREYELSYKIELVGEEAKDAVEELLRKKRKAKSEPWKKYVH